jgi:hypothetical protein
VAERQLRPTNPRTESERLAKESRLNRIDFLRTELQTAFTFASLAETQQSMDTPQHAARSLAEAEKGYATIVRFLSDPKHSKYIIEDERVELSAGMERLRARLDELARK